MCCVSYKQHGFIRGVEGTCLKGNFVLLDMDIHLLCDTNFIDRVLYSVTGSQDLAGGQGHWRASHC